MTRKIIKSTSRGQITLPKQWRRAFGTDVYLIEMHDQSLTIKPLDIDVAAGEELLFDAERDNNGKGVRPEEIIRILKKIQHERD
ncbi:hypothetical protein A3H22_03975 [Candidatus Peribacteria bacterium RIFCSPLOWO2_12_FULL_55_15]|nr:MAG: hypothetical protein A2789_03760 [Candidatus Peribacteria bacterium RIFCSPHIGHO2_01_FULL_54_22]OGJ63172.1 MAG: hypothetical protein A3D12_03430 [Candidatus Peribacteria bacterium RIFCSPHIGHO2_02_FULL_55_24]OGJ64174.1 MAG: hypothetical protein A3E47_03825 [Candidatus Peribacteria bacterium RIFCSPHIGHO2_12_FULL_54_10]OGJ68272.1 MAG: hypothetical protein A2947_00015 [Candidatus Peribacteria bacterium RIFCSPLOWO2_01_FULL_54_110]OGJ69165.1 MAG: hypothetical protein A3H90_01175 [Candidatus Pe